VLNLAEQVFRDYVYVADVFTSAPELIEAVEQYITVHNQKPKPPIWTSESIDILTKVVRANSR